MRKVFICFAFLTFFASWSIPCVSQPRSVQSHPRNKSPKASVQSIKSSPNPVESPAPTQIQNELGVLDMALMVGAGKKQSRELSVLASYTILKNLIEGSSFPNHLALEASFARAQWPDDLVKQNRFSFTVDGRWSLHFTEVLLPYVSLGMRYDRHWASARGFTSGAEGKLGSHFKFGTRYMLTNLLGVRLEIDPSLETLRAGVQFNF